jgi:CBS domain-containing protein
MKVKEVMVAPPVCCSRDTNLGIAADIMWRENCGILPITNSDDGITGVVTDRDMFIALATRNRLAGDLTVGEVTSGRVFSCKPDDDIHTALAMMAKHAVRRLPVVNNLNQVVGMLSMDDIAREAQMGDRPELSCNDVVHYFRGTCEPRGAGAVHKNLAA